MKHNPKDPENNWVWDQNIKSPPFFPRKLHRFIACSIALIASLYFVYWITLLNSPNPSLHSAAVNAISHIENLPKPPLFPAVAPSPEKTSLRHIIFGIAASSNLWTSRKEYIKLWYRPNQMNGVVWMDKSVPKSNDSHLLPSIKISGDTSQFNYEYSGGYRSAIRLSRIVSETLRLGFKDVRWFVMGDDDTFFVPENLVSVLGKYDHTQYYYIGSSSESHTQNIRFSYRMAYGGGGFAISYPLAKALAKMQDRCIQRYPGLYGSDDRIQACTSEIGVPLTKEVGFHQFDVYGNLFGLLAAHPVAPLVTLHHLDLVEPIFPKTDRGRVSTYTQTDRVQALNRLTIPMKIDPAALLQQSICYDKTRSWTISVSWGYAVQIIRGIVSAREMEIPARTFLHWYKRADQDGYAFNTRPLSNNVCEKPFVYYMSNVTYQNSNKTKTVSEYVRTQLPNPDCKWKIADPARIDKIRVYKRPDPYMWEKAPRRNCCRVLRAKKQRTIAVDVGPCGEDEFIEVR